MRLYLPEVERVVDKSFRFTGAATALQNMNQWQRVCVADCRLRCPDMGIGVMILAVLKIHLHRMFTRDGWHLDFYRVTQDFTEAVLIVCRGFTMMRQQRYCVILFW